MVGGLGFVINFSILLLLHTTLGWPRFISQFIGAEVALFSNFMLHHHWTYKQHKVKKSFWSLIVQFHAVSWPAIIGSALMVSFFGSVLKMNDFAALVLSSTVALFWNFIWSKYVVWRDEGVKGTANK